MCDVAGADGSREVIAFVGGLDITKGRYDTAVHAVLPGPEGEFNDDLYQVCHSAARQKVLRKPDACVVEEPPTTDPFVAGEPSTYATCARTSSRNLRGMPLHSLSMGMWGNTVCSRALPMPVRALTGLQRLW